MPCLQEDNGPVRSTLRREGAQDACDRAHGKPADKPKKQSRNLEPPPISMTPYGADGSVLITVRSPDGEPEVYIGYPVDITIRGKL